MKRWLPIICFFIGLFPAMGLANTVAGKPKAASTVAASRACETATLSSVEQFGLAAFHIVTSHPVSQHTNNFQETASGVLACHVFHSSNVFCRAVEMFGNNQLSFNYPSHNFW